MMPNHCGRAEPERPAALLQTPADIHIVASDAELRIKSADRLETRLAEGHVATGDVFGLAINIGNEVPGTGLPTRVACAAQTLIRRADHLAIVLARDGRRTVGRSVVHHNHFVIRVGEYFETFERIANGSSAVVAADHNG